MRCYTTPRVKKKQDTKLLAITSLTIIRFSIFFSLLDSEGNLYQSHIQISHHTLNVSLNYLVKYEFRKNGIILKYVLQLMMNHKVEFKVRWVTLLHVYH